MSPIDQDQHPPDPQIPLYFYSFGPFSFTSELRVRELEGLSGKATFPVHITLGAAPRSLENASSYGALCLVKADEYLLNIPGIARYYVTGGNAVRVELASDAPSADVSGYLLGSIFGALCHQNGLLPLHASAIEIDGRVTAFLGESGAGKSTLAACLQARGHRIVSDDICILEQTSAAKHVIPVAGWLKLWRRSLDFLGETPEEANRIFRANDKFRVYLEPASAPQPRLANMVFLARALSADEPAKLEPLAIPETIALMMRLTYLGYITELTGSHARVFRQCAQALEGARSFRLTVPWDLSQLDATLDLLDTTLLKPAVPAATIPSSR